MSEYRFVDFRRRGGRADLTFKRHPRNTFNTEMLEDIVAALRELRDDETLKVLVIRGAGDHFCSGIEWRELQTEQVGVYMPLYTRVFNYLNHIKGITIAAVQGDAFGPGSEIAMFCDITFAAKSAKFGFQEIRAGLFPPIATAVLPHLVGRNRALDWILSTKPISAQEAFDANMVARVLLDDDLEAFVEEYAGRINNLSAPALMLCKRAVDGALYSNVPEALKTTESTYMIDLMNCIDPHEGLAAMIENRAPIWKNK